MALPREHLLDELAMAAVSAVAARAGGVVAGGRDYGVDGIARRISQETGYSAYLPSPYTFDFQLKSTTLIDDSGEEFSYPLDVRAYNLIAGRAATSSRLYLFLCCFDRDERTWLREGRDGLHIGGRLYWWADAGALSMRRRSQTIRIPTSRRLDVGTFGRFLDMMDIRRSHV